MLIIVSGPDRVGKSTLIKRLHDQVDGDCFISHHGPPPHDQGCIFDFYKDDVLQWQKEEQTYAIFDRAWPCSFILEQHRRRNFGHLEDLVDLELWINDAVECPVVHLAQLRPWSWSAPLHVEELEAEGLHGWALRDEYVARMQEHKVYTEQLQTFFEDVTMFPSVVLTESTSGSDALSLARQAVIQSSK